MHVTNLSEVTGQPSGWEHKTPKEARLYYYGPGWAHAPRKAHDDEGEPQHHQ